MDDVPEAEKQLLFTCLHVIDELWESDSSGSEDEDIAIVFTMKKRKLNQPVLVSNYVLIIDQFDSETFRKNFRLDRATFDFLLEEIKDSLKNKTCFGRRQKDPKLQLFITLWFFSNPDSYRELSSRFGVGLATAVRCVRRVVKALYVRRSKFIHWPEDPIEIAETFEQKYRFPGVIGAVDVTHINIPLDRGGQGYINRKGHVSIQLQVVCDNQMRFTHCYTGQVGSVHDQRVFRLSGLQDICNSDEYFPNDTHIVGDAAYFIQSTFQGQRSLDRSANPLQ